MLQSEAPGEQQLDRIITTDIATGIIILRPDDTKRDHRNGLSRRDPRRPRTIRQWEIHPPQRPRRPSPPRRRNSHRNNHRQRRQKNLRQTNRPSYGLRRAGRRPVPAPNGAGDAPLLRDAPPVRLLVARREGGGGGVRRHDDREQLREGSVRRGEEKSEHSS
ncbi:hypothetical protein LINPERPRIM_LOCUS4468 [Linum perenne]